MNLRRSARLASLGFLLGIAIAAAASAAAVIRLKVTAEVANIRQKPSISSLIVRQIPEGALLEAERKEGEWYLVNLEPDETGNKTGYVHESLVLPLDEPAVPEKKTRVVEQVARPKPKPAETTATTTRTPPERTEAPPVRRQEPAVQPRTQAADPTPAGALRPALILGGGVLMAAVGDINDGSQGLADYYGFQLGSTAGITMSPLRFVFPFEAEVQIPVGGRFAFSLAAGYTGASAQSLVTYAMTGSADTFTSTPGFSAILVKAGIVFEPVSFFFVKAGFMVVRAKASYDYRFSHDTYWQEWAGDASGFGIGGYAGLGVALPLGSSFDFVVEAGGQVARIGGLEGTGTYLNSNLIEPTEEIGTLYAYDAKPTPLDAFPLVFIRSKKPTEGGVANAREAVLDLLGGSLKAGLKFKF